MIIAGWHYEDRPMGYELLAIDGTVRTPTIPDAKVRLARIFFRAGTIRMTLDGTNPVGGSVGIPFFDGYEDNFSRSELNVIKFIREGSVNGEAHIVYYR